MKFHIYDLLILSTF